MARDQEKKKTRRRNKKGTDEGFVEGGTGEQKRGAKGRHSRVDIFPYIGKCRIALKKGERGLLMLGGGKTDWERKKKKLMG